MLCTVIISTLVVLLLTCWPKTRYSLLVLSKKCAAGFPDSLKVAKPPKGCYVSERVGDKVYFVFQDPSQVCFVTNVFPRVHG